MSRRAAALLKLGFLLAGAALFGALVWNAGPRAVYEELRGFGWGIGLLLLPSLAVYLIDAWAWRVSFSTPPQIGFLRLFLVRSAGESLNATLPAAYLGGEPVKAYLLQRQGVNGPDAMASVLVAKTAMTVAQILFVILGVLAATLSPRAREHLPALLVATGLALVGATVGVGLAYLGQRQGLGRMLQGLTRRLGIGAALVERHAAALERMDAALGQFYRQDRGRFLFATGLALVGWLFEVVEVAVFALLLDLPLGPFEVFAIGSLATVVKAAGFFIPGSLGAQEGGNVLLFLAFGLSEVTGVTFSVVRRFRELVWIAFGLLLLTWLGKGGRPPVSSDPGTPAADPPLFATTGSVGPAEPPAGPESEPLEGVAR